MSVIDEIKAANAEWMKYFKARDFKGLMDQCYTEDCEVIMANTPLLTGRDACGGAFEGAYKAGVDSVKIETQDVMGDNDSPSERGIFHMYTADGGIANKGNYIVVWKRVDGKLRIRWDAPVTDLPK